MKKLLSLIFTLLLVPQLSIASTSKDLKSILDEYYFSITVVWDQKDAVFAAKQEEKLLHELQTLQKEGLTKEEISSAFNSFTKLDFNEVQNELMILDLNSPEQVKTYIDEKLHQSYARGASWEAGEIAGAIVGGAVLIFGVVAIGGAMINIYNCIAYGVGDAAC
jgi:hypothetical protein